MKQIDRYLEDNDHLLARLKMSGMIRGPEGVWFYRSRGDYIDVIDFRASITSGYLEVPVMCFNRNFVTHSDLALFPRGFTTDMPDITGLSISHYEKWVAGTPSPWPTGTKNDISISIDSLVDIIEDTVSKWLTDINADDLLWQTISPGYRESPHGQYIKNKLKL